MRMCGAPEHLEWLASGRGAPSLLPDEPPVPGLAATRLLLDLVILGGLA